MTAHLKLTAANMAASALTLADLPFPKANLLFHASADKVTEEDIVGTTTEKRVISFTDLNNDTAYSVATTHRIGKRELVNGIQTVRPSLQAGVSTTDRNYAFPDTFIKDRNYITLCGVSKADPVATGVQTLWGAGANANNTSTNASALFNVEYVTPTSIRFRAEAMVDGLTNTDISAVVSGLPARFISWIAEMDLAAGTLTMTVLGVGSTTVALPNAVAPSLSSLVVRNGLFRQVAPSPTNAKQGNMFTGWFRQIVGFTDKMPNRQRGLLYSTFRAECAELNV